MSFMRSVALNEVFERQQSPVDGARKQLAPNEQLHKEQADNQQVSGIKHRVKTQTYVCVNCQPEHIPRGTCANQIDTDSSQG